jgi:hypothetical protein
MVDIWGHGSNGSLINMAYNTYYGTGYINSTLIESWFEMNSYSTQVAQFAVWIYMNWQGIMGENLYALSKHIESWNILCG